MSCPVSLYRRTAKVIRAASFHSGLAQNIARDAERAVRSGNCAAGRSMLRSALRIIRRDVKLKKRGYYDEFMRTPPRRKQRRR